MPKRKEIMGTLPLILNNKNISYNKTYGVSINDQTQEDSKSPDTISD